MSTRLRRVLPVAFAVVMIAALAVVVVSMSTTSPPLRDAWLTAKVQSQYLTDRDVRGSQLVVTTTDGVVTISGPVGNVREREEAVAIARTTDGVVRVIDRLWIAGEDPVGTSGTVSGDQNIRMAVQGRYFEDPQIKARQIGVLAEDGVVTLTGAVASEEEARHAVALARSVGGVRDVRNELTWTAANQAAAGGLEDNGRPAPEPDRWITTQIQAKFFTDPVTSGRGIEVTTVDGVVRLAGIVPSESARDQAVEVARSIEGVRDVDATGLQVVSGGEPAGVLPSGADLRPLP